MARTASIAISDSTIFAGQTALVTVTLTDSTNLANSQNRTECRLAAQGCDILSLVITGPWVFSGGSWIFGNILYTDISSRTLRSVTTNGNPGLSLTGVSGPWTLQYTVRPSPGTVGARTFTFSSFSSQYGGTTELDPASASLGVSILSEIDPVTAPTAPSGLTATASGTSTVNLAWTDNSTNEWQFDVYRSTDNVVFSQIATLAAGSVTYSNIGLTPDTLYYYKVAAYNGRGQNFSSVANATTGAVPAVPTAPSDLATTEVTDTTASFSWTDNSSTESGFRLYRSVESGGPYAQVVTVQAGISAAIDIDLSPGATYYYVVRAFNDGGESTSSNEVTVQTTELQTAFAPVSGFTFDPAGADLISMTQIAGKVLIVSPYDRMLVYANRRWYRGGLKQHRTAPSVSDSSGGALTGTFKAWTCLYSSDRVTRSIPSPASDSTGALTTQMITVTPEGNQAFTISNATNATPIVITTTAEHGLTTGDQVLVGGVLGNTAANGLWLVTVTSTTAFSLDTSVGNGAYTSGGTVSTGIKCRDIAYDSSGNQIEAADFCEIYLQEINSMDRPVRIATIPLTQLSYTTPNDLTVVDLQDGTRRPMEVGLESTIPPACGLIEYFNNRIYLTGERTIKPTQAQTAVATVTFTNATNTITCSNYKFTDALYQKEVYRNKAPTGWFVVDVIDDSTIEIRHSDPDKDEKGYDGTTATVYDFAFGARPRVYRSPFFTGEAQAGITFSPETINPSTILEGELEPDDDDDIVGLISSKDVLFVFKRNKVMFLRGGEGVDYSGYEFPTVQTISRGSGLLAPKSLCRDRSDVIYGLNEQGPFACTTAGLQKIGTMAGTAFLFQRFFNVADARGGVGAWFPREDYGVWAGLTRTSATTSGLDGFIYDSRTGWVLPFTLPSKVYSFTVCPMDTGDYQLMYGDGNGQTCIMLQRDLYTDNVDYTSASPYANEVSYTCYATSGTIAESQAITVKGFRPHVNQDPLTTAITMTVGVDTKKRIDNVASAFSADISRTIATNTSPTIKRITPRRGQRIKVRVSYPSSRSERLEFQGLEVEAMTHGVGAAV